MFKVNKEIAKVDCGFLESGAVYPEDGGDTVRQNFFKNLQEWCNNKKYVRELIIWKTKMYNN